MTKTTTTTQYTQDGAHETIESLLGTREADALLDAAVAGKADPRSARSLAIEFCLDDHMGRDEAIRCVQALQA